jgi:hypothetical protein
MRKMIFSKVDFPAPFLPIMQLININNNKMQMAFFLLMDTPTALGLCGFFSINTYLSALKKW